MKRLAWLFAVPVLLSVAAAQIGSSLNSHGNDLQGNDSQRSDSQNGSGSSNSQSTSSQASWHEADPGDRMFFPRDMFWGWAAARPGASAQ